MEQKKTLDELGVKNCIGCKNPIGNRKPYLIFILHTSHLKEPKTSLEKALKEEWERKKDD